MHNAGFKQIRDNSRPKQEGIGTVYIDISRLVGFQILVLQLCASGKYMNAQIICVTFATEEDLAIQGLWIYFVCYLSTQL